MSEKAAMREKLAAFKDITVTTSTTHNLEIGGKTTSKADAIANLCSLSFDKKKKMLWLSDARAQMTGP